MEVLVRFVVAEPEPMAWVKVARLPMSRLVGTCWD